MLCPVYAPLVLSSQNDCIMQCGGIIVMQVVMVSSQQMNNPMELARCHAAGGCEF